ncbi:hypothetical protein [Ramlibacter pinisoli]|uniref:hypothetical protein n=1 Tax=Ramlibacter sp. CGMCC 1.13660 TaxID=2755558 RepID=UPI0012F9D5C0|nr:hypothetical protein [Ramlibacter sp. CGMCC 1.13660]
MEVDLQPSPVLIIPGGHTVSVPAPSEGWDMALGDVARLVPPPFNIVPLVTPPNDAPFINGPAAGLGPTDGPSPCMVVMPEVAGTARPPAIPPAPLGLPAPPAGPRTEPAVLAPAPSVVKASSPGVVAVLDFIAVEGRLGWEPPPVLVPGTCGTTCATAAEQAAMASRVKSLFIADRRSWS